MKRVIMVASISVALLFGGCGKPRVSQPVPTKSYGAYSSAGTPNSNGGYRKIGNPYQVAGHWYYPLTSAAGYSETGTASWYGTEFHGKKTANGERYDMHAMSAAHTTLPLPTMVRVTNLDNGRSVVVRVNDRGPFVKNRIIDLSYAAAKALGYDHTGTAPVRVQALGNRMAVGSRALSNEPRPVASPVRTPSVATVAAARPGAMYIQLGAFSSPANADRLKRELENNYPSVGIYAKNGGYSEIYRVRIGPFDDEKSIETHVLLLQSQGYANAIVVIE